jgi:hypothetical protein
LKKKNSKKIKTFYLKTKKIKYLYTKPVMMEVMMIKRRFFICLLLFLPSPGLVSASSSLSSFDSSECLELKALLQTLKIINPELKQQFIELLRLADTLVKLMESYKDKVLSVDFKNLLNQMGQMVKSSLDNVKKSPITAITLQTGISLLTTACALLTVWQVWQVWQGLDGWILQSQIFNKKWPDIKQLFTDLTIVSAKINIEIDVAKREILVEKMKLMVVNIFDKIENIQLLIERSSSQLSKTSCFSIAGLLIGIGLFFTPLTPFQLIIVKIAVVTNGFLALFSGVQLVRLNVLDTEVVDIFNRAKQWENLK